MKAPSVRHPCETAAKGIDLAADSSGSVHDLSKCSQAQPRMAPHVNLLRWDGYDLRYPKYRRQWPVAVSISESLMRAASMRQLESPISR